MRYMEKERNEKESGIRGRGRTCRRDGGWKQAWHQPLQSLPPGMWGGSGGRANGILLDGSQGFCGKGGSSYVGGALHLRGKGFGNGVFFRLQPAVCVLPEL